jgi:hypothetical protein
MPEGWKDYEEAANKGPKTIALKVIALVAVISVVIFVIAYALSWGSEGAKVAKDEFGPQALLEKYQWFKDSSANLDKKVADIHAYESRMEELTASYNGTPRSGWHRDDREQYNVWSSELVGIIASYNQQAADYNSQMAKFNWRFANVGDLPKGAEIPLPREYKPYIYSIKEV